MSKENSTDPAPDLSAIRSAAAALAPHIVRTPLHHWHGREIDTLVGPETQVLLKLELFQQSGTFKARGVMSNLLALSDDARRCGVTAMSAGNHAVAVAWGASRLGINAKVVMQATASPVRVAAAKAYGAEVLIATDGPSGFALAEKISRDESRAFIHPFDSPLTVLGTGTLGLEMLEQAGSLDALIIAIGGGGLAAGVASTVKALHPACRIYGVEPEGADTMHRSFAAGSAQRIDRVQTIADSLGPPMALPYTFGLCRQSVDELVKVSDDEICRAMALLYREMKLAVEPAGAAATAALLFHLGETLRGQRVGVIVCGSNIGIDAFAELIRRGGN